MLVSSPRSPRITGYYKLEPGRWIHFYKESKLPMSGGPYKVINYYHNGWGFHCFLMNPKGELVEYNPSLGLLDTIPLSTIYEVYVLSKKEIKEALSKTLKELEKKAFECLKYLADILGNHFGVGFDPQNSRNALTSEEIITRYC